METQYRQELALERVKRAFKWRRRAQKHIAESLMDALETGLSFRDIGAALGTDGANILRTLRRYQRMMSAGSADS